MSNMNGTAASIAMDLEVLRLVREHDIQDDGLPGWKVPAHIPHQRLSGLARRGYLCFTPGSRWWLTKLGRAYLDAWPDAAS